MAVYLSRARHKEPLHWMLLGYLAGLVLWTGGVLARFTVTDRVARRALRVCSRHPARLGVLAAHRDGLRGGAPRARREPGVVVGVVSSLFLLALFTNDGHRLFLRKIDFERSRPDRRVRRAALLGVPRVGLRLRGMGMLLYLRAARAMLRGDARRRGSLLAIASAVRPRRARSSCSSCCRCTTTCTPIGLLVAMALLSLAIFRYQLLESLPLARDAVLAHLDDGVVMASASGASRTGTRRGAHPRRAALRRGCRPRRRARRCARPGATFLLERTSPRPCAVRTADGRLIEVTTAVVDEGRGEPAGRFAIVSDRSAIDRAEQLARQTQRLEMVGALAGEVALQINDPLTFVRASLVEIERLGARVEPARGGPDAELADELADLRAVALETLEGVERIRRIVDGMRALSSAERVGSASVDLNEVAREALRWRSSASRAATGRRSARARDVPGRAAIPTGSCRWC
jgi:hypothetical protein